MVQVTSPYALSEEQVLANLQTSMQGLTQVEATQRLSHYGKNQLTPKKGISPLTLYLQQFKNTLTIILLLATLLILVIYFFGEKDPADLFEAGLIFAIVIMTTVLGFIQEFKAEKAIASLKKLLAFKAKIMRGGKEQEVDVALLVPGDIVILEEGAKVPADIRLLRNYALSVNEASLTGESVPVTKSVAALWKDAQLADQKNMLFAGTAVVTGRAFGVVVNTGDTTEIGKIAESVAETHDEVTPIQKKLDKIGKSIGYIILGVCVLVFIFVMFFAKDFATLPWFPRILQSFILAVALAVAAIPEGLPAVVTVTLALGTQRMLKKNALVRKLTAIETLGSTDVICSDKTGTLTKGEMTVRSIYYNGIMHEMSGVGYSVKGALSAAGKAVRNATIAPILEAGMLCNNAMLKDDGSIVGDPTEAALLVSAVKGSIQHTGQRIGEIPFSSERKMMSVVIQKGDQYIVYAKGAPEVLLNHCHTIQKGDKAPVLSADDRSALVTAMNTMTGKALRVLAFASKVLSKDEYAKLAQNPQQLEEGLTMLGLQGMMDPPRSEVKPLIVQCRASGIRVIMITGDHAATASAVAKDIGITGDVATGEALDSMNDEDFAKAVATVNVYARVNPSFKMRIVAALQEKGHIVAMTGDGVNDAPALKKADIGIAMGITGTDVAKEAADVVLLDDHFSTIIAAIEEGRGMYHNIRKFVSYLLLCNISEVLLVFFAIFFFQKLPLSATMLLWINVVTDGLPAIALGLDKAEKGILKHKPQVFQADILTNRLWLEMVIFGLLMGIGVLGIFLITLPQGLPAAQGSAFTAIVVFELLMVFVIRSRYKIGFFSNPWLLLAIGMTFFLQIALVYMPFTQRLFVIAPLSSLVWGYIIVSSLWLWVAFSLIQRLLDYRGIDANRKAAMLTVEAGRKTTP